jgi:hypothetical protein
MNAAAQGALNLAAGISAVLSAQGINTSNITSGVDAIVGAYSDVAGRISGLNVNFSSLANNGSGRSGGSRNLNDVWYQRYGRETYLYNRGEIDAQVYWDGFKRVNDQLLKEFGDSYLRDWRTRDLQWLNEGYKKERELIEKSFKLRIITAQEYYTKLETLRERYFSGSNMNNRIIEENREAFYYATVSEVQDRIKVMEHL